MKKLKQTNASAHLVRYMAQDA